MKKSAAPSEKTYTLKATVWLYPGMAGWHFITVDKKTSHEIKERFGKSARGWGSLPITITLGATRWNTSIFPDKKSGCYILPLKAEARRREKIRNGDAIAFSLHIRA